MRKQSLDDSSAPKKKINRGTNDELEILGMIVSNHPGLRITVLEKLRQAKKRVSARPTKSANRDP